MVDPPLADDEKPDEATFGRLALALLQELAASHPAVAEQATALGIELEGAAVLNSAESA